MSKIEVASEVTGSVWKILVKAGDKVAEDDPLIICESMKMEIPLSAPEDGVVAEIKVAEGDAINEGSTAVILEV